MKWQPIKTAPKDGTAILVYASEEGYSGFFVVAWEHGVVWRYGDDLEPPTPTHWMPLPNPPV
jgi:hypothetical protein